MSGITAPSSTRVQPSAGQISDLQQLRATGFKFDPGGMEQGAWLNLAQSRNAPTDIKAAYKEFVDIAGGRTDRPSLLQAMSLASAYFTASAPSATASDARAFVQTTENNLNYQLDKIGPTEIFSAPLQSAASAILANTDIGKTEWGASLQKALSMDIAFRAGLSEGIWQGGKELVTGIATYAGKAIQFAGDKSLSGYAGDALRGVTGKMPEWLEAVVPSHARGLQSSATLDKAIRGADNYMGTHTPAQAAADIGKAIGKAWDGLKASHAAAAAKGPEAEARWWGQVTGRVGFEVAATFVPLAGVAGKLSKGAKVADAAGDVVRTGDVVADAAKGADKVEDLSDVRQATEILTVPPLRKAYIDAVEALKTKAVQMQNAGDTSENIARTLHSDRRELGIKFKDLTPEAKRIEIYTRNLEKYGDELGPTIEWLRDKGKSWEQIIESATRTGGNDLNF